jgi:hypothetical protein
MSLNLVWHVENPNELCVDAAQKQQPRWKLVGLLLTMGLGLLGTASVAENASNPLAAVNNTDFRLQGKSADVGDTYDFFIDGAYMVTPRLKLKYELHYLSTDVIGTRENGLEKLVLKPIYFPSEGQLSGGWGYRTAVGFDLIIDLGDQAKGIGIGTNQFAPLVGVAFSHANSGWTLIPLAQHFTDIGEGPDISQTSGRLIALKPFGDANWFKVDAKIPYDWENETWPITAEFQIGRTIRDGIGLYADALVGVGPDRPYDWGLGVGLRLNY